MEIQIKKNRIYGTELPDGEYKITQIGKNTPKTKILDKGTKLYYKIQEMVFECELLEDLFFYRTKHWKLKIIGKCQTILNKEEIKADTPSALMGDVGLAVTQKKFNSRHVPIHFFLDKKMNTSLGQIIEYKEKELCLFESELKEMIAEMEDEIASSKKKVLD